jgi:hypothetical protein
MNRAVWTKATCKDCMFHSKGSCHKYPPKTDRKEGETYYPKVAFYRGLNITDYMSACSEYEPITERTNQ